MEKKQRVIGFVCASALLFFAAGRAPAQTQNTITNTYAAKFICGVVPQTAIDAVPDAQTGRYATKINVHNNTGVLINFRKKVIRLIGSQSLTLEPPTDPLFKVNESLKEDQAMEVVCRDIYKYVGIAPGTPPYIEGFVILEVFFTQPGGVTPPPDPLDVEGIYTYKGDVPAINNNPAGGSGVSIAVVVYPAKNNKHVMH